MPDSSDGAHGNKDEKTASELEREALSECSKFTPINGMNNTQQSRSTGGDALLKAALDTDGSDDSELPDGPASYVYLGLKNKPIRKQEVFEPHETDPSKINAVFELKLPDGSGWFIQSDVLPEQRELTEEDDLDEGNVFIPDLVAAKVPRRRAGDSYPSVPWNKTSTWKWERTIKGRTQVWTPAFIFRRFSARTFKYEYIYVGECHMTGVDPNNKRWRYNYHKWIDQIKRRSDSSYVQKKRCDRWTVAEIRAMYAGINDFLHTNGIEAYGGATDASLQGILDAINKAGNKNRFMVALRRQITTSNALKNPSMAYLRKHAPDLAKYIADGGILSDSERFPEKFIPEEEFPTDLKVNRPKRKREKESVEHEVPLEPADTEMEADRSADVEMSETA